MTLELGEVIEERGRHTADFFRHGGDFGPAASNPFHNRPRQLTIRRQAGLFGVLGEVGAAIAGFRWARGAVEFGDDLEIGLGHEVANRQLAFDQERQRRRLHPADGESIAPLLAEGQGTRPAEVEANQPIGLRPTARGRGQAVEILTGPQAGKGAFDGIGSEGRKPKSVETFAAAGGLIDITEDQLALAAGIRRANHLLDLVRPQDPFDHRILLPALGQNLERPAPRQHRQRAPPPRAPLRLDLVRLRQTDQVANRPGDHITVAMQVAVAPARGAQHPSKITGHGGFFGDNGNAHAGGMIAPFAAEWAVPVLLEVARKPLETAADGERRRRPGDPFSGQGIFAVRELDEETAFDAVSRHLRALEVAHRVGCRTTAERPAGAAETQRKNQVGF